MKSLSTRPRNAVLSLAGAVVCALVSTVSAQTNYYSPNGTEYPVVGSLPGDQVFPDAAISPTNGFVVWQDNATDGDGWGISARRLDATLSGTLGTFRVNVTAVGDQENARVALLKNGGAAFVWQGGKSGFQHIYARFLTPTNTFYSTNDILVSTYTNNFQINPALAVLTNGTVAVVWASYNQVGSNSMQDVYGQILSATGAKIGTNFLINQFITFNQRTPAVAALKNGGFVAAWVSEQQRSLSPGWGTNTVFTSAGGILVPSVDIYARLFSSNGVATSGEILANTGVNPCANPTMAAAADGGFLLAWGEKDRVTTTNSWDIYARSFTSAGVGGTAGLINTRLFGDQYIPHVSGIGLDYLVAWTSLGQDGSREGVFARFVHKDGVPVGLEFRVNTSTVGQQMHPAIASDGVSQFLVVWTSFVGLPNNFDLFAQRFMNVSAVLQPMSAPYVLRPFVVGNGAYLPQLVVTWAPLLGLSVTNYEVYVDGAGTPAGVVTGNAWTMTAANGLTANSTHSFMVDYVTADGRRSPISPSASGTTWGGLNWGGIPSEWMIAYYGSDISQWPSAGTQLAPNMTLAQVFLSGGNPLDSSTWLHQEFTRTPQGMFVSWNTQPGSTYQVQVTTDFKTWTDLGSPRFAAGTADSINVGGASASYYQIKLLR